MKKTLILFFVAVIFISSFGASKLSAATQVANKEAAIIFFMPVGDPANPFIHMSEIGIIAASSLFPNLKISRVYPFSDEYIQEYIKFSAMRGHDYIIGIGFYYAEAFDKIADRFPNKNFIVIDGKSKKKNVKSITFNNYEAGYLAGVVASVISETKKVGFIGGRESKPILDFEKGFRDAVNIINNSVAVSSKMISKGNDGYSNSKAGFDIADDMYKSGCDIVFAAAGASGFGSINAARANEKYIIGVDSDQDSIAKGFVITSIVKRLDTAIVNLLQDISTDKYNANEVSYNVGNVGFTLSPFNYSRDKIGKVKLDKIFDNIFEIKKKYDY